MFPEDEDEYGGDSSLRWSGMCGNARLVIGDLRDAVRLIERSGSRRVDDVVGRALGASRRGDLVSARFESYAVRSEMAAYKEKAERDFTARREQECLNMIRLEIELDHPQPESRSWWQKLTRLKPPEDGAASPSQTAYHSVSCACPACLAQDCSVDGSAPQQFPPCTGLYFGRAPQRPADARILFEQMPEEFGCRP